ncbi:Kef-type K+ transport system, membrane component KefB [Actinacidiphila alni]|uniref:Kef-type K+ transport system, membrane component KefB n=1 Tax=Actinacidiphila alni TaxID=380248 RepID=A0A1I2J732_9ACTN|nr:cation:proton antiporter [Actinacidiphila alni]SFF49017.1 Kef-type K+ transport system, membrane component KefB [Actinacidiphila alni]
MSPISMAAETVDPLPQHTLLVFLLQIGALLLLALVLGRLAGRFGLPTIVGELAAGVLLGPSVLLHTAPGLSGWLFPQDATQMHLLDAVGQLGVLLLVGFTGMHLDLKVVRTHGGKAAGVSSAALLLPLALGVWLGYALPGELRPADADPAVFAWFVGVAMCVSSIPVIARVLVDMKLIHRNVGQMILVVGTVDDAVGWLLVSVVTAMATTGVGAHEIATPLWHLAVVILVVLTVGRWLVRSVLRVVSRAASRGVTISATVILLVLAGAGAQALGFEAVFGAFLCGILIGAQGTDAQARQLEPLNATVLSFLSPLFFALAGLRIDLTALIHPKTALWGLCALFVAVASKFLGAFIGSVFSRLSRWEALALGAGINARGVIQVIIAVVGVRLGLLNTAMYSIIVLIAILTPLMAPPILRVATKRIEYTADEARREERVLALQGMPDALEPDAAGPVAVPRTPAGDPAHERGVPVHPT